MSAFRCALASLLGLALGAFPASTAAAASLALAVGSGSGAAGAEVRVPVAATGAAGLGAMQFELVFDPAVFEVLSVEAGRAWPGAMVEASAATPGTFRVAAVSSQAVAADGELLVLVLKVGEGKAAASPLAAERLRAWEHGSHFEMRVTATAGRLERTGSSWALGRTELLIGLLLLAALFGGLLLLALAVFFWLRGRSRAAPAKAPLRCAGCGHPLTGDARFCPHCGRPL